MAMLTCSQPMQKHSKFSIYNKIRLGLPLSLIFFVLMLLNSCKGKEEISIVWEDSRAKALVIPKSIFNGGGIDQLQVRLQKYIDPVLGEFEKEDDAIVFKPVVPFTAGLVYEIFSGKEMIGSISIPLPANARKTALIQIYPTTDTVPENLLKIYLEFSAPMREGEALQYIHLLDENRDTLHDVFLDLQPELWNKERTALTLWLDPGRIKRDLIPNRKMGNPLRKGNWYTLTVAPEWKDVQGLPIQKSVDKKFFVRERDSRSPELISWIIHTPKAGTNQPMQISFGESLDYFLIGETINILNEKNEIIQGQIKIAEKERMIVFTPQQPWKEGNYRLKVKAILEDLAGNNLNRPFDRDTKTQKQVFDKDAFEREFIIDK
jgi:hypothetical protein